jgi:DNA helicase-2/ATP-dependent DNA helicase PcrA
MFRIFGPPGTGKTTTLLDMVDGALGEGVPPSRIAFLAFTRKAAAEAKERAAVRFKLDPKQDLPFFRTLHSFAYRSLSVQKQDLMQREHFDDLSRKIGVELNVTNSFNPEDGPALTHEHPVLGLINLSRLKKTALQEEYNNSDIEMPWVEVDYIDRAFQQYKKVNRLLDYTDMLALFAAEADRICPSFDYCFLDEAQDLSPLQWDIAHVLDAKSKKMYVAGDDDQAIYKWAGADVDTFINLPGGSEVLEQSYRIPKAVHEVAQRIVSRIHRRFPKVYNPRPAQGTVQRLASIEEIDMSEGTWLIMAQANYMLTPLATDLKSQGYLFERNGSRSISEKMSTAINGWEQLRAGNQVSLLTVQAIYSYMAGNNVRIARGKKKILGDADDLFSLTKLQLEHGLLATAAMIWHEALDKLPSADRAYITALLRRGEKFNSKPRIRLSTIHQTKGGEAQSVVVFLDLTTAALKGNADDLHRVFYVAVTRTKENLFLIEPEDFTRAYDI